MDPVANSVSYCCIWKGGRVLYTYTIGNHEMDNLAALCLEMIPPYHRWYFETIGNNTFSFLMEDGFVYFAIVCKSLGNSQVLRFLHKLREEFTRMGKSSCLQEQLFPVIRHLVASLQLAEETVWPQAQNPSPCNNANGHTEGGTSTKAPLLGKPNKHERRKMKDHTIAMRDIEMEEHRRSTDRGLRIIEPGPLDPNDQGTSPSSLHKDFTSSRTRSSSSSTSHRKWCRQVRIILAVDAAVCVVLFIIWLVICGGIECIR